MKFKTILKWTFRVLLLAFIVIQFIRPTRNTGKVHGPTDISKTVNVPENVELILQDACYDCHSNQTQYPWYTNIQPLGWWMQDHVNEGKRELNFSEFDDYGIDKGRHKLHECVEMIEEDEMPLSSYTMIHGKLDENQKKILITWAKNSMDKIGK